MITGTDEQWQQQYAKRCLCGHRYNEHINGKGPCTYCPPFDPCNSFHEAPGCVEGGAA